MPKVVKGDALGVVNKSLGLAGTGAPITEFNDGQLDQVIDVAPLIRRGRTIAGSTGIFRMVFENAHAGSGSLNSGWIPYETGTVGAIPPFPSDIKRGDEVWLLWAGCRQTAGSGAVAIEAAIFFGAVQQGFGIDDAGAAVVSVTAPIIARWNDVDAVSGQLLLRDATTGLFVQKLGIRVPPKGDIAVAGGEMTVTFDTTTDGVGTYELMLYVGVFPVGLGQDGVV